MSPAPWNDEPLPAQFQADQEPAVVDVSLDGAKKVPMRSYPVSHHPVDAPICPECQALELTFFDPTCRGCRSHLLASSGVEQVFAALRQWVPQVQRAVEFLVGEALRRGAHPDDRDVLTDMTMLMYAAKAGASGVGDPAGAARTAGRLLDLGADPALRCKWTQMTALHYAAYFDVAPVVEGLLLRSRGADVDEACPELDGGAALHIAAANLSVAAARALLAFGADPGLRDDLARVPADCVPDPEEFGGPAEDAEELAAKMEKVLAGRHVEIEDLEDDKEDDVDEDLSSRKKKKQQQQGAISGRTVLKALGLQVGDRVLVNGSKLGTLRFCGTTDFAAGVWAGVALDSADGGRNDGSVRGVVYFRCRENHGVFVPAARVAKVGRAFREESKPVPRANVVNHGKVDTSNVVSRLTDCLNVIEEKQEIRVGDRVSVSDAQHRGGVRGPEAADGTVRFVGQVDFVDDENKWYGVELDLPVGRHDGTVQGVRYFAAAPDAGIFVTESKLTKLTAASASAPAPAPPAAANKPAPPPAAARSPRRATAGLGRSASVRVSSSTRRAPPGGNRPRDDSAVGDSSSRPGSAAGSSVRSRNPLMSRTPAQAKEDGWQTVSVQQFSRFKKTVPKKYLEVGTSAICVHSKEMGVVRFVGRVDFSGGIWAGVELREPREGRHDGHVKGKRYFTCKPGHGVLIRPRLLSVHGINGEKLLKPESEYPF